MNRSDDEILADLSMAQKRAWDPDGYLRRGREMRLAEDVEPLLHRAVAAEAAVDRVRQVVAGARKIGGTPGCVLAADVERALDGA
jgi:hypothetical protein